MTTEHRRTRLDAYLDGELSPDAAAAVESHLEGCPACRAAAQAASEIDGILGGERHPLPAGFAARVAAEARGRRTPVAPLWWLALPASWRAGLAAVLVLAAAGGMLLGQRAGALPDTAETLAATLQSPEVVAMGAARPVAVPAERRQP